MIVTSAQDSLTVTQSALTDLMMKTLAAPVTDQARELVTTV